MIHLSCMYVCTYVHICTLFMCGYWCAVCISTFRCEWMWVEQWRLLRLLHQQPRLLQLWLQRVCWFRPRWEALHLQTRVHTEWRYSHLWWWERTTMNGVAGRSSAHVLCMLVLHRFSINIPLHEFIYAVTLMQRWTFYLPTLQTLTSVLLTMEAVTMTAPTPQAATYVSAIRDMSCMWTSKCACVSLTNRIHITSYLGRMYTFICTVSHA